MGLQASILLAAFNLAIVPLLCLGVALLLSSTLRSLPLRHAVLVAGMMACLFSPVVVFVGWWWALGQLPAFSSTPIALSNPIEVARQSTDEAARMSDDTNLAAPATIDKGTWPTPQADEVGEAISASKSMPNSFAINSTPTSISPSTTPWNGWSEGRFSWSFASLRTFLGTLLVAIWFLGIIRFAALGMNRWRRTHSWLLNCLSHRDPRCRNAYTLAAKKLGLKHAPPLLESESLAAPVVVGLMRPAVVIPMEAADLFTPSQLRSVLTHELAHIARKDPWVVGLQSWLTTWYWWNPLVWIACRKVSELRELLCDDIAISLHPLPRDYAESILAMAERALCRETSIESLGISMSTSSELERRIRRILSESTSRFETRLTRFSFFGIVSFASLLAIGGALAQVPTRETSTKPIDGKGSVDRQVVAGDLGKPSAPSHRMSGQVFQSNGQIAPSARIRVSGHKNSGVAASIVADRDGKFDFEIRIASNALDSVQVRAENDVGTELAFHRFEREGMNRVTEGMQVKLSPPRIIEVEVVDQDNRPVPAAQVAVQLEYPHIADGHKTDPSGKVKIRLPELAKILSVVTWKDRLGLDYRLYTLNREQKADINAVAPEFPRNKPERLVLSGAKPVKVKVAEPSAGAISGVELIPFLLENERENRSLNLSLFHQTFSQYSELNGETTFAWIPAWQREPITFFPNDSRYEPASGRYDPKTGDGSLTMELKRLVPIRGRVLGPSGNPVEGVSISAVGSGRGPDPFSASTKTDRDGKYELQVASNHAYIVTAIGNRMAAPALTGFVVFPDRPLEGQDFRMTNATRLHGRLVNDQNQEPLANQRVIVFQLGTSLDDVPAEAVPNPNQSPYRSQPMIPYHGTTDASGEFSFDLGDGSYAFTVPQDPKSQKFEIAGEEELQLTMTTTVMPEVELLGLVIGNDDMPLAGAKLIGSPQTLLAKGWQAATDREGKFRVRRKEEPTYVHGVSSDQSLAGIQEVAENKKAFIMKLQPVGKARGRLVNKNLDPIAGQEIEYGIEVRGVRRTFSIQFGGKVYTDANGEFEMGGLVPNWNYSLSLPVKNKVLPKLGVVTVKPGESLTLGEIIAPSL